MHAERPIYWRWFPVEGKVQRIKADMPRRMVSCLKPQASPKGFIKAVLKDRWGRGWSQGMWSACSQFWLADGEVTGLLTLSIFRCQWVWDSQQGVNFFHLVTAFSICKTTWGCASDCAIWLFQKWAIAEDKGKGSVLGKVHRVLLSYKVNASFLPLRWIGFNHLCSSCYSAQY